MTTDRLKQWLVPLLVLLSMAALTFFVWRQQVEHQHSLLVQRTEDVSVESGRRLEVFVASHLRVASIFARRWSTHESRDFSEKRFEEFASVLVEELPGYYAIGLIPPDLGQGWTVPGGVPIPEIVLDPGRRQVLEESRKIGDAVLSEPFESVQGATTVYAVLPLLRESEFLGYLVVDFRTRALIDDCFHERIRSKFHFVIRDGERVIYRSSEDIDDEYFSMAAARASVTIPVLNRAWTLDMVPQREKARAYGWAANLPLPLLGIFMSLGLSFLVFLLIRRMDLYRAARDQQTLLSRKVLAAQEEERARISRELHDELGQLLTALRLEMGWLEKRMPVEKAMETSALGNAVPLVEQATEELRRVCRGLRPPLLDDLGLEPAVGLLVDELRERSAVKVSTEISLEEHKGRLPREVALCAYRILQESLTNVSRHSRATEVKIGLTGSPDRLSLEVIDNGCGFDVDGLGGMQGYGLEGMRERANLVGGSLEVSSRPEQGTRVSFEVSLAGKIKEAQS